MYQESKLKKSESLKENKNDKVLICGSCVRANFFCFLLVC